MSARKIDIRTAIAMREAGFSVKQIAEEFDASPSTVSGALINAGCTALSKDKKAVAANRRVRIVAMYMAGERNSDIARVLGVRPSYVSTVASRAGVATPRALVVPPAFVRPDAAPKAIPAGMSPLQAAVLTRGGTYTGRADIALELNVSFNAVQAAWHQVRGMA